jgi:hypothetical protein
MTAEGNGYLFSSSQVRGLGIMTSFSITGPSRFQQKRVVPSIAIKDLVFGFVPCVLDRPLEVGNPARVKKTLATFSCDSDVILIYEKKKVRTYMFSGMVFNFSAFVFFGIDLSVGSLLAPIALPADILRKCSSANIIVQSRSK